MSRKAALSLIIAALTITVWLAGTTALLFLTDH